MPIVWGWLWQAEDDEKTCAVCIALDGTLHPIDEDFDDHVQGRCMPEPLDESDADQSDAQILDNHGYDQTGIEWFAEQDEAYQKEVLGPGKFALYRAGRISLSDLVEYTFDAWGSVPREKSLSELGV